MKTCLRRAQEFGLVVGVFALSTFASSAQVATPLSKSQPANSRAITQQLSPTIRTAVVTDDPVGRLGGRVYSTGAGDILLRILTPVGLPYPDEATILVINGKQIRVPNPNVSAYADDIGIMAPGTNRWFTSNREYNRTVNLGKLPPGEIIFGIRTPQGDVLQSGESSRNPDGQAHAVVKRHVSGAIDVWFEDRTGSSMPASDRDFNDAVFQLSGAVSDNNAVGELLRLIKEQKGEVRDQAITALKRIDPKAAAAAGVN